MNKFEIEFNKRKRRHGIIANMTFIILLFCVVALLAFSCYLFMNPEQIGEFFGKIFIGFKEANK